MAGGGIKINNIKISGGGVDGATFIPSVDSEGNLSWSNNKGYSNPVTVNIKGPQGKQGEQGPQGKQGEKGEQGKRGEQGFSGAVIVSQKLISSTEEGNTYEQKFDNGLVTTFTAPRGPIGSTGNIDETLTLKGYAADAKATGVAINNVKKDVENLFAITKASNLFAINKKSQAYTERETAEGDNIVDGQYTPVNLIEGDTVASGNELKHAYFKAIKSTGRNLISLANTVERTIGGVTVTVVNNNTLHFKGKPTADWTRFFIQDITDMLEDGKTYVGSQSVYFPSPVTDNYVYINITAVNKNTGNTDNQIVCASGEDCFTVNKSKYSKYTVAIMNGRTYNSSTGEAFTGSFDLDISFMFQYGNKSTGFEPYTENLFELPETLELKKWDSLNPQTGELTNGSGRIVLDGTEKWNRATFTETAARYDSNVLDGIVDQSVPIRAITNLPFEYVNWSQEVGTFFVAGSNYSLTFSTDITKYPTVEDWKNYLAELKANGTPLIVEYKKKTLTITKLDNIPKSYKAYNGGMETVIQGDTDNSEYGAMPTITQEYYVVLGGDDNE